MTEKILVVEDEKYKREDIVELAIRPVCGDNCQIFEAETEKQAADYIDNNTFALVITDLRLKKGVTEEAGFRIVDKVKAKNKNTKIIIISNNIRPEYFSENADIELIDREAENPEMYATTGDFKSYIPPLKHKIAQTMEQYRQNRNIVSIDQIWEKDQRTRKCSYWLLLMAGVHIEKENNLFKEIAFWEKFCSRSKAIFVPVQQHEDVFINLSEKYTVAELPALIVGGNKELTPNIMFKAKVLNKINKDELSRLLSKVHLELCRGKDIISLKREIQLGKFWDDIVDVLPQAADFLGHLLEYIV